MRSARRFSIYRAMAGARWHDLLDPKFADRLAAMRGPGEGYSEVILRLAEAS